MNSSSSYFVSFSTQVIFERWSLLFCYFLRWKSIRTIMNFTIHDGWNINQEMISDSASSVINGLALVFLPQLNFVSLSYSLELQLEKWNSTWIKSHFSFFNFRNALFSMLYSCKKRRLMDMVGLLLPPGAISMAQESKTGRLTWPSI